MKLQPIITNVQAGVVSAVLELLLVISFAALIFSGPLAAHLATALVLLLISSIIIGLVGTLGSSYPGMLVSLRTPVIPVIAAMVAATADDCGTSRPFHAGVAAPSVGGSAP